MFMYINVQSLGQLSGSGKHDKSTIAKSATVVSTTAPRESKINGVSNTFHIFRQHGNAAHSSCPTSPVTNGAVPGNLRLCSRVLQIHGSHSISQCRFGLLNWWSQLSQLGISMDFYGFVDSRNGPSPWQTL
jgi:hypothetical protein